MGVHNDVNWCMANGGAASYHCTVSIIVGVGGLIHARGRAGLPVRARCRRQPRVRDDELRIVPCSRNAARCAIKRMLGAQPVSRPRSAGTLAAYLRSADGKRYLAQILVSGMIGPIDTQGHKFNGMMPQSSVPN